MVPIRPRILHSLSARSWPTLSGAQEEAAAVLRRRRDARLRGPMPGATDWDPCRNMVPIRPRILHSLSARSWPTPSGAQEEAAAVKEATAAAMHDGEVQCRKNAHTLRGDRGPNVRSGCQRGKVHRQRARACALSLLVTVVCGAVQSSRRKRTKSREPEGRRVVSKPLVNKGALKGIFSERIPKALVSESGKSPFKKSNYPKKSKIYHKHIRSLSHPRDAAAYCCAARSLPISNNMLTIRKFLFSPRSLVPPPACMASFCVFFFYRTTGTLRHTSSVSPTGPPGD